MAKISGELSRRARQVLDLVYRWGSITAGEVVQALPDLPSYSAARSILRNLESGGHVRHEVREKRYVYVPVLPRDVARKRAMGHLLDVFFQGSPVLAMKALLQISAKELREADLRSLQRCLEEAEKEGR